MSQYTAQSRAWEVLVPHLQTEIQGLLRLHPVARSWTVLLEFPLYRLRKRIDAVVLAGRYVIVIEAKVGAKSFASADRRQVEDYALDLRDFHAGSRGKVIVPILWCTGSASGRLPSLDTKPEPGLTEVAELGNSGLADFLLRVPDQPLLGDEYGASWDTAAYTPVPSIVEAATSIFAGHTVRAIANADAANLSQAAARVVELIRDASVSGARALIFLTGVPGSGKTLAGLQAVHDAIDTGTERPGDIVYLSGNTPLVVVLREALARDEYERAERRQAIGEIRRRVRTRIQHINDYLKDAYSPGNLLPPHEHVIVFDEAQRAWDEKHGREKFNRDASEPALLLELMERHSDWCACVCLVGGGQEINTGEDGVSGWGDALRTMEPSRAARWTVHAPDDVLQGGVSTGGAKIGILPPAITVKRERELQLHVPQRSFRSPSVSTWVNAVLNGDVEGAAHLAEHIGEYPIRMTRSADEMKAWLRRMARGNRRYGLLASSGARRLRADGFGLTLNAAAGDEIAHWYLDPPGDIRASFALEVPANEYTCQGLELDFAGICWGGDQLWSLHEQCWRIQALRGAKWQNVTSPPRRRFSMNSYRVLLTRAREGMVIWIPEGDPADETRKPKPLDDTARYLARCGAQPLSCAHSYGPRTRVAGDGAVSVRPRPGDGGCAS